MRSIRDRLILCVAALALTGGDCREPGTSGSSGKFYFYYRDPTFVTDLALIPFAPNGTQVELVTEPRSSGCHHGTATFAQVRSADPQIATATLTAEHTIAVVTGAAGTVDIELLDESENVVDSVAVDVESIASLDFGRSTVPVQVVPGSYSVDVTMRDASGSAIGANPGRITHAATGAATVTQSDSFTGTTLEIAVGAPGVASVTATADAASATLQLTGVAPADITGITLGTGSFAPAYNANNQVEVVWSIPMRGADPVYGAPCNWQINDPSVHLVSNSAQTSLSESALDNSQFKLDASGRFDVTCTIGSAQLTVTLQR